MSLKASINKLMLRQNLDKQSCQEALHEMLCKNANPIQTAAFLVLLRTKTETAEELLGLAAALKLTIIPVPTKHRVLDIVGTGGDGANTINISTGSAILAASCGIKIAKHGNRAVSSQAGCADVLEALGVVIDLPAEKISASIDEIGIGFCFSPNFHPAIHQLRTLRKQLHVPTTFNLLGPLLNPTNPAHYVLGVYHDSLLYPMATALKEMGTRGSLIVHGSGLDELSCIGTAKILEVTKNNINEYTLDPHELGLSYCTLADLQGGNANTNAKLLLEVFSEGHSSRRKAIAETLILNAAHALTLYGLHSTLTDAILHAKENLQNGAALTLLKNWIEFSHV